VNTLNVAEEIIEERTARCGSHRDVTLVTDACALGAIDVRCLVQTASVLT